MTASLYVYIGTFLLLVLSECSWAFLDLFRYNVESFDIDQYQYVGDPLGVSCVYDENQAGFHQEKFNGSTEIPIALAEGLNNGKPLTLYFDGIASHLNQNGSTYKYVKEWSTASNSNICYMTYAHEITPNNIVETFAQANDMVKNHRLQFTAKLARDLILSVREQCYQNDKPGCLKEMTQVTMLGFSFGAHIASQTCRDLYKATGQKVGKLVGLDPAGIALTLKTYNQAFIRQGDASYVQIIHTDNLAGTILYTGDVDIIVDSPVALLYKHQFSVYMHMATAMRKLILIAEEDGIGRVVQTNPDSPQEEGVPKPNEVSIGIYSELNESKRGKRYKISFRDFPGEVRTEILRGSIAHVVKAKM